MVAFHNIWPWSKECQNTLKKKKINKFILGGKKSSINKDHLNAPIEKGGISFLDIQAHNEAINLMWLKMYLLENRPTWALITDILIGNCISKSKKVNKSLTTNTFIQSWDPTINGKYNLPTDLQRMISVAKKYKVSLNALAIPEKVQRALPAWYHIASNNLLRGFTQKKQQNAYERNAKPNQLVTWSS